MNKINATPLVYKVSHSEHQLKPSDFDDSVSDPIDSEEIFERIRNITDPEHPLTLEQLNVTQKSHIYVDDANGTAVVEFTPTIPHCSMATLIGLCIRVCLLRSLPHRFKLDVRIREGTHNSEEAINKQLNDKERVAAALENNNLLEVVEQCLSTVY
ncbi:Mitotic spindle-associated MMXD complex subunit MIP18 [Smittium mucronatum]|uniref:Mitotic spindle-associated MMXD complex subunit MIP18 n=1 Tax=Smittium mucronatum TaxID=133383 RepID=A0A1R0H942_9FUNG|nr:Mitotic spindle-associated MMXD complex subunit MIP18 [Smittium mucronatum]